jgi:hypothetical protein
MTAAQFAAQPATAPSNSGPTGPRTAEGKARCRLNAFRHGLTGHVFVFAAEEAVAYAKHSAAINEHYKPVGPFETALAAQVAAGMWRLQRVHVIEEGIFAMDAAQDAEPDAHGIVSTPSIIGPARAWIEQGKSFDLLGKYERRIRRALDQDQSKLEQLQAVRRSQPEPVSCCQDAPAIVPPPSPAPPRESVFSRETPPLEVCRREAVREVEQGLAQQQPRPKAA